MRWYVYLTLHEALPSQSSHESGESCMEGRGGQGWKRCKLADKSHSSKPHHPCHLQCHSPHSFYLHYQCFASSFWPFWLIFSEMCHQVIMTLQSVVWIAAVKTQHISAHGDSHCQWRPWLLRSWFETVFLPLYTCPHLPALMGDAARAEEGWLSAIGVTMQCTVEGGHCNSPNHQESTYPSAQFEARIVGSRISSHKTWHHLLQWWCRS